MIKSGCNREFPGPWLIAEDSWPPEEGFSQGLELSLRTEGAREQREPLKDVLEIELGNWETYCSVSSDPCALICWGLCSTKARPCVGLRSSCQPVKSSRTSW